MAAMCSLRVWMSSTIRCRSSFSLRSLSSFQNPDSRPRLGLRFSLPESQEGEAPTKKSRNEKKREAKRAVRWGMDLSQFPPPQIKQILNVARIEEDAFEALMLVKRLGPDVKEGKRRQYNYIGRLLRDAQPELMDALIQATKDGDTATFHSLSGKQSCSPESEEPAIQICETEEEEECGDYLEIANRWFEGFVNRNSSITNEVYALHNVDFDRQVAIQNMTTILESPILQAMEKYFMDDLQRELRKLVRRLQSVQGMELVEQNVEGLDDLSHAKMSLIRFLRGLARKTLTSSCLMH